MWQIIKDESAKGRVLAHVEENLLKRNVSLHFHFLVVLTGYCWNTSCWDTNIEKADVFQKYFETAYKVIKIVKLNQ